MDELRLLLLTLGGLFVVGLAVWEFRRSRARRQGGSADDAAAAAGRRGGRQEPSLDHSEPRDSGEDLDLPDIRTGDPGRDPPLVVLGEGRSASGSVAIGISDEVAVDRPGIPAAVAAQDDDFRDDEIQDEVEEGVLGPAREVVATDLTPASGAVSIQWPPERQERILALRVVPPSGDRFGGRSLRLALTSNGLTHGPQDIFHWVAEDGRVILSAAGLTRPGTFDLALMDGQFFLGLQMFSVLPGPLPPQRMLEELVAVGRDIASRLGGQVLDEVGRPLDAARIEALQRSLVTPQPENGG